MAKVSVTATDELNSEDVEQLIKKNQDAILIVRDGLELKLRRRGIDFWETIGILNFWADCLKHQFYKGE